jgi:hypothetical protein
MKDVTYFRSPAEMRRWLAKHHRTAAELRVGYCKVGSGELSVTWPQAVRASGLKAFEAREEKRSGVYSYEQRRAK